MLFFQHEIYFYQKVYKNPKMFFMKEYPFGHLHLVSSNFETQCQAKKIDPDMGISYKIEQSWIYT